MDDVDDQDNIRQCREEHKRMLFGQIERLR
jgi:hypothetical protein